MKQLVLRDYIISGLTVIFFTLMLGITIFSVGYTSKQFSGDAMASDIVHIAKVFN